MLRRFISRITPAHTAAVLTLALLSWPVYLVTAETTDNSVTAIPSALAVGPAIIEPVASPGEQVRASVRVSNITKTALPINSVVRDLIPMEKLLPATDKKLFNASKWFKVEPAEFILKPGETKIVFITVNVPKDASPGGHYATVYFQPLVSNHVLTPGTAYLNARVGVLNFLTVKGDIREKATLEGIGGGRIRQFGPVEMTLPIRNDGNVHLLPQGKVTIYDWQGNKVSDTKIPNGILLPGTVREYRVKWGSRWTIGYFTVRADVHYGTGNTGRTVAESRLIVVPWLLGSIGLIIVVSVLIFVVRTYSRWGETIRVLRGKPRKYGKIYNRKSRD